MKGDQIPDNDHIARYCPFRRLSEFNGKPQATAFILKKPIPNSPEEKSLSVNWLEFLKCLNRNNEINEIRRIYSTIFRKVGSQAKIAVLNVGDVCKNVLNKSPDQRKLEVQHDPEEKDPSHSGIYNLRQNDELIAEIICETIQEIYPAR